MPLPPELAASFDAMALLEAMPVGVVRLTDGRVDFVNQALTAMTGRSAEQLLGRHLCELVAPGDAEKIERRRLARQGGDPTSPQRYEADVLLADGSPMRVELEPRVLGPGCVVVAVRDARRNPQESAVLGALSELALRVQRERTAGGVLRVAGEGLRALGMSSAVLRLDGDALVVEHLEADREIVRLAEAGLGRPWREWRVPLSALPAERQLHAEHRSVFDDAFPELLVALARELGFPPGLLELEQLAQAGVGRAVFCPMFVGARHWGFLDVAGDELTARDAAALGLFAAKVASALDIAGNIAALERRNRQLEALQEVSQAGSETDLARLSATLARIAAEATGSELAAICLLDPRRGELVLSAGHGCRGGFFPGQAVPIDSQLGRVALALETSALHSCSLPAELSGCSAAEGLEEIALVPLHLQGRLAGILTLGRRRAEPYTDEQRRFSAQLGAQVAIHLENARLYADVNRRIGLLTVLFELSHMGTEALEVAPLVEKVIDQLFGAVAVDGVALHLLEGERLVLAGERGTEVGWAMVRELALDHATLCGRTALERRTQVVDRENWPRLGLNLLRKAGFSHAVAVPLVATERLIGTLCMVRRADSRFAEDEVGLLESSAAQVAVAIERARLFEQERRRVEELQLFLEIGRVISASLDLEQILEISAASMARMAEATQAFVFLLEPGGRTLRGVAVSAPEHRDHFRTVRVGLDEDSAAALTMRTRGPVRVEDVREGANLRRDLTEHYGPKSVLALPLLVRGEAIGAVVIADQLRTRAWSEAQIDRATAVARQVAVAAANARLYEDLKRSYDELARTQQELVKRERLAALGELSAVVAHEVRNPLGVIFNSLGSLRRALKPTGDAAMLLDIVGEEADRLNRIVDELLDFTRPNDPRLEPEPLADLLAGAADAAAPLAESAGVGVLIDREGAQVEVPADARMMRQALLNLVINAIQATPRGGVVRLSAGVEQRHGRPVARLEVRDSGPGVPRDVAQRVFQPFFTTKASGTGLGLAVVKRIIEAHRGEVALESPPEGGARFVVRLPLEPR